MAVPDRSIPKVVDTIIVGNGPSALILSYILHGNVPHYNAAKPHPDPILHRKLSDATSLLRRDFNELTAHFSASRLSYSTHALPANVLLDTLLRPLVDTNPAECKSCVEWRYEPSKRVSHLVLGNTSQAGGLWANDPTPGSCETGTLSYAEMLSLPGYSFQDHIRRAGKSQHADFHRPTRKEVSAYLAEYPKRVDIADSILNNSKVERICRTRQGFQISPHNISCQHLVLASGVFSSLVPAPPILHPLVANSSLTFANHLPILIVGSGFTAADVILSLPTHQKIIHVYKWDPQRSSPLQACHPRAYPEYASVYRLMKTSAKRRLDCQAIQSPIRQKKSNPFFDARDWDSVYQGFPNAVIKGVRLCGDSASITIQESNGHFSLHEISSLRCVIGRRGSLGYLDANLAAEILDSPQSLAREINDISSRTLRAKVQQGFELAPNVFAIGSLTGDSLIRFAFGGCCFVAGEIVGRAMHAEEEDMKCHGSQNGGVSTSMCNGPPRQKLGAMSDEYGQTNGHLHLDSVREIRTDG